MSNERAESTDDIAWSIFIWSFYAGCAAALFVVGFVVADAVRKNRAAVSGNEVSSIFDKARHVRRRRSSPGANVPGDKNMEQDSPDA